MSILSDNTFFVLILSQSFFLTDTCSDIAGEYSRYNHGKQKAMSEVTIKPEKYQTFSSRMANNIITTFKIDRSCKGKYYGNEGAEWKMEYKQSTCEIQFDVLNVVWTKKVCNM